MSDSTISRAIENLMAIYPLLHKSIARPLRCQGLLTPGAIYTLGVLKNNGNLSMSEIGKNLAIPKPNVTTLVDKLIAEDMVERLPNENDRRIINIKITPKGVETFLTLKKEISEELRNRLEVLNENDIEKLSFYSQQIKEMLRSVLKNDEKHLQ
jgi:DNA-binding MarR family transcriptional regulator